MREDKIMWLDQLLTTIENHGWVCFLIFLGILALISAARGE